MRYSHCVILFSSIVAASGCQADIDTEALAQRIRDSVAVDRQARFGLPQGPARGAAEGALRLDSADYPRIYDAVLPAPALGTVDRDPPVDSRPMLDARFLAHDGEHGQPDPMPAAVMAAMLATGRFRSACGGDTLPTCSEGAGVSYAVSRIYRIEPGAARVFVVWTDSVSATESVYRLEEGARSWEVAGQATVRYRGPKRPL